MPRSRRDIVARLLAKKSGPPAENLQETRQKKPNARPARAARATKRPLRDSSTDSSTESGSEDFELQSDEKRPRKISKPGKRRNNVAIPAPLPPAKRKKSVKEQRAAAWYRATVDSGPSKPRIEYSDEDRLPRLKGRAAEMSAGSPLDFVKLFLSDETLDATVSATNHGKKGKTPFKDQPLTRAELIKWFAISIVMGYDKQPSTAAYWHRKKPG
jgi:hypothetical protein